MALHHRYWESTKIPPWDQGKRLGRSYLSVLYHMASANIGIGDYFYGYARVPAGETWQIVSAHVVDKLGAGLVQGLQGWKRQRLVAMVPRWDSPTASVAVPRPDTPWDHNIPEGELPLWERYWNGSTYLSWGNGDTGLVVIRPANPVVSSLRLPGGAQIRLCCEIAESATGGAGELYFVLSVLRAKAALDVAARINPKKWEEVAACIKEAAEIAALAEETRP